MMGSGRRLTTKIAKLTAARDPKIQAYSMGRYARPMKTAHATSVASGPASSDSAEVPVLPFRRGVAHQHLRAGELHREPGVVPAVSAADEDVSGLVRDHVRPRA